MRFTHVPTGNEILCAGMDDPEKIKSIAGITSVWCEEATELDELDFNQLELRVRGQTANYKQFIITFNPISEQHWLKRRFFDIPDDEVYILHTTYRDNSFLDADYIHHLTERVKANPNLHKVYVLGEWGKVDFGGEFLKSWSTIKHTRQVSYDPTLAVWLSFDENVNPYFPCGIFQISDDNEVRMLDCLALKNPDNTVKAMARAILQLLRHWKHTGHVYVCGDSTSQKDDVKQEKGFDLFRLLITELDEVKPIRRVSKSNPNVRPSADFFNAILAYNEQGISFVADESCRVAILDFENTKEDKNGKVDKKTVLDPVTKVSYQPYGHFCVIGSTMIKTINGEKRIDSITNEDKVLTRDGYKKVLAVHNNGLKIVNKYKLNNIEITCTPDHKIFTYNFGYIEIQKLVTYWIQQDIFICIFDENKKICKQKLLSIMVNDLHVTRNQQTEQNAFTLAGGLKSMVNKQKKGFIGTSILLKLAKYLKDFTSITLMKIRLIIQSKIYNLFAVKNILVNMLKKHWQQIQYTKLNFMQQVLKRQKFGINQMQAENGIVNLHQKECQNANTLKNNVLFAHQIIKQKQFNQKQNFVPINVNQNTDVEAELITSIVNVKNVEMNLQKINTQQKNIVQENAQQVYDLTVEDTHEYFANGVLLHNCDLTRYLLTSVFASQYARFQTGIIKPLVVVGKDAEYKSVSRF